MTQTIDRRKGSSSVSSRPRRTIRRRLVRLLGILSLSLVGLLLLGLLSQALASAVDASHYPPPGKLVDIGATDSISIAQGQAVPRSFLMRD